MKRLSKRIVTFMAAVALCMSSAVIAHAEPDTSSEFQVKLQSTENGTLAFADSEDATKAYKPGDTVTIQVTPNDGYLMKTFTVVEEADPEEIVSDKGMESLKNGCIEFTMPETDVLVFGTFAEAKTIDGLLPMTFEVYQEMFGGNEIQMDEEKYLAVHEAGYYVPGIDDIVLTDMEAYLAGLITPFSLYASPELQATDKRAVIEVPDSSVASNLLVYGNNTTGVFVHTTWKSATTSDGVKHDAYCLEMDMNPPQLGDQSVYILKNYETVRKLFYYGFGGPKSSATADIFAKATYYPYGTGTSKSCYMLQHSTLSQEYSQRHSWDAAYFPDQIALMAELVNRVNSLPAIPTSNIWFESGGVKNPTHLKTWAVGSNQRTDTISVRASSSSNSITFKLPAGVTCTTGENKSYTGTVTLNAGTDFYLWAPLTTSGTYSTGSIGGNESEFNVYVTHYDDSKQDMGFWDLAPTSYRTNFSVDWMSKGVLAVQKTSSNPTLTNNNSCYSLEGAVYGVYDGSGKEVARLTTNANGYAEKNDLASGKYTVKEITAPKGYALDKTTHNVTVTSGKTEKLNVTEVPIMDPVGILLGKIDKDTNSNKPAGSLSLKDAEFTIKYYGELLSDNRDPAAAGKTPLRTWVFKTDEDGYTRYGAKYLVSGDDLYYSSSGTESLPIGTITIQETKAPKGYTINPEIFVIKITEDGKDVEGVNTYNMPTIPEQSINLNIIKKVAGKNIFIEGVTFKHTLPNGTTETLKTDKNGAILLKGVVAGDHIFEETATADGFSLNPGKVTIRVSENGDMKVIANTSNSATGSMTLESSNGISTLTVEDVYAPYILRLRKTNENGLDLEGAEFTIYSDKECKNVVQTVTTGADGLALVKGLKVETNYYIKETKAPQGYRIPVTEDGKDIVTTIYVKSEPTQDLFEYYVNEQKHTETTGDYAITGTKAERIVSLHVTDYITAQLPETGTHGLLILTIVGVGLMAAAIIISKKGKGERDVEKK